MSRTPPAAPPEPATSIARALHQRLPDRIRGAGTLYLWPQQGRSTARTPGALRGAGFVQGFLPGRPSHAPVVG